MIRPSPRHFGQAVTLVKRPKTLDFTCLICPLPLQAEQRFRLTAGLAAGTLTLAAILAADNVDFLFRSQKRLLPVSG